MVLTLVDPVSRKQICMRLVTPDARVLTDPAQSLEDAGLKDGDQLTAIVGQANLASTDKAFASWCCGGDSVVTWGDAHSGGHSSAVQDQLRSVQQVQATDGAFAAILEDGSVVTWGDPLSGGDSFRSPRSAEECAAGSGDKSGICRDPGRRLCCRVG